MSKAAWRSPKDNFGIAAPLAGLVVALPALYFGLEHAGPLEAAESMHGTRAGSSILLALMYGRMAANWRRRHPPRFA